MIEIRKNVNLDNLVQVESLHGVTFSNENKGHKFIVSCMSGGELLTLTGTVTARFMRANNTTILIAGNDYTGIADGKAVVTLPQDCYNVPGRFQMAIFLTDDGTTSCIYACVGSVQRTQEGTLIDSGDAVPTLTELLAQIDACEQATADATAAASAANAAAESASTAGESKFIRYDAAQSLTANQQAQARANIGASTGAVLYSEDQSLTDEQKTVARNNTGSASATDVDDLKSAVFENGGTTERTITTETGIAMQASAKSIAFGETLSSQSTYRLTMDCSAYPVGLSKVELASSTSSSGVVQMLTNAGTAQNRVYEFTPETDTVKYLRVTFASSYSGSGTYDITLKETNIQLEKTFYTKTEIDAGFYTKTESDNKYYAKTAVDAKFAVNADIMETVSNIYPGEVGSFSPTSGITQGSTIRLRSAAHIVDDSIVAFKAASGYEFAVFAWDKVSSTYVGVWNGSTYIKSPGFAWLTEFTQINSAYKYKILLRNANNTSATMTVDEWQNCLITRYLYCSLDAYEMPKTYTLANIKASEEQMLNVTYTPIRPMPLTNSAGYVDAGTVCKGLPYSSTRSVCKYIGQHVTFYTFLSAIKNPRSVLYTRRIKYGTLGKTYYGVTCFTFVSYAHGSRLGYFDNELQRHADTEQYEIVGPYDVQVGDTLFTTTLPNAMSHCAMVHDIYKDKYGRIISIAISEAMPPNCQVNTYPFVVNGNKIIADYDFVVHRLKKRIDRATGNFDYGTYDKLAYVKGYPDETPETLVYPDIMPEYGDKACVEAGTDVTINVLSTTGYSRIDIYKDNTLIDTKTTLADFVMSNIAYGTYKFELVGDSASSTAYLIAADVHGSYNSSTGIITFSSANATPVFAASYGDWERAGDNAGVQKFIMRFNATEVANGSANVSDLITADRNCIQIGFLTEFGVAMWWSTKLTDEWEYWTPPA